MPKPKIFPAALFAVILFGVAIPGCAQKSFAQKGSARDDCLSCHGPGMVAADFSAIYADPKSHHPVGVSYPSGAHAAPGFKLPNGRSAGITFFDSNGNGQPDSDEIQMFGARSAAMITCASCHMEHGVAPLPAKATADSYLRVRNTGSALCTTCHSQ